MSTEAAAVMPVTPLPAQRTFATGSVRVVRTGLRSRVARAYATSPLRLLTPRNHGDGAWLFASSFGGGLVGGDSVSLDVTVDEGASAFVSTQSSTKVYRSTSSATQDVRVRVEPGGLLVLAPDPVVCFAGSSYHQHQWFDVAEDAKLVAVDWVSSGRRIAGERWAFREYVSRQEIRVGGRLIVHDAVSLRSTDGDLAERMGRFDVLAVIAIVGRSLRDDAASAGRLVMSAPLARHASVLAAAAPLPAASDGDLGCLVRIAGPSVEAVGAIVRECLAFVPALLGDDPWARKW
jgi:urease accessory protein